LGKNTERRPFRGYQSEYLHMRGKVIRDWRKLHNVDLHNWHSLSKAVCVIKSGHIAGMRKIQKA
jgi:hypothetical protein